MAFILIFVCDEKGTLGVEYNHWIIEINICFLPHCLAQYIVGTSSTAANRKSFRQFVVCNRGGAIRELVANGWMPVACSHSRRKLNRRAPSVRYASLHHASARALDAWASHHTGAAQ